MIGDPRPDADDLRGALVPAADLEAQQAYLEIAARRADAAAAERAIFGGVHSHAGRKLIDRGLDALARAIETAQARPSGASGDAAMKEIDAETAAYLTLRAAIDAAAKGDPVSKTAIALARTLEDEVRYRSLTADEPRLMRELARAARSRSGYAAKRAVIERGLAAAGAPRNDLWPLRTRKLLGARLLDLAIAATGAFQVERADANDTGARAASLKLGFTPNAAARAARMEALAAAARSPLAPMVAPPKPWRGPRGGGYLTARAALPLVTAMRPEQEAMIRRADMPIALRAVNAAQSTAFRINAQVLDVMRALDADYAADPTAARAGVPAPAPSPPPKDPSARRFWRAAERARRSRRYAFVQMLQAAQRFRAFDRLFLPAQLDFRGRLYYAPRLTPQGPDAMRALFHFAEPKPLGEEGWKWLAIHAANCGDFEKISKAPLSDRVGWTLENEERILAVAADPRAEGFWLEADRPWQFLAACFEWAGYVRDGEAFASRLPVTLDGTCSGIQHFSLALRDEVAGDAVNLTGREHAADIYSEVAERVVELLRGDLEGEDAEAAALSRAWLAFGIDRSVCKRPTMTYGYGARAYGYADQIFEDTLRPAKEAFDVGARADWPFGATSARRAARHLAARMTEAIEQVVLGAARAMRWLQDVAALASRNGVALEWTAPDGFPVRQAYPKENVRRVSTTIAGEVRRFNLREPAAALDPRRQRQGVAPNFVHALDACHLRLTVTRAQEEGLRSFLLVHDSFGVHAADTPRFFQLIRETMVEMYDVVDVVAAFRDEIAAVLPEAARADIPPPPERGRLDLAAVLESEFCFS